jgi:poly(A) polymerase/tRNA nucleotidyltransferase (CCA-adding enzyme)
MAYDTSSPTPTERIAALVAARDIDGLREELVKLLAGPNSAASLHALDAAGLLTRIIPELEPARATDQPIVHFLPVLAHLLESVTAVEWLLDQLHTAVNGNEWALTMRDGEQPKPPIPSPQSALPVAVQTHPELRYQSAYAERLRQHFAEQLGDRYPRAALFKLATLLHDVAKPQTKQPKPGGGVSFHEHQTIGGEIALEIAQRLGFSDREVRYICVVVREHMRPGQLAALDEVTLRAVERFFRATGDAGPDVLLHMLADHMATRGPLIDLAAWRAQAAWIDALLDTIWGEVVELEQPLLNGDDLMQALGIAPGPLVGRLLAAVGEAQAGGEITTSAQALELARRLWRSMGLA